MLVFWTPDPIRAGLPARLQILLEESEPRGKYRFEFVRRPPSKEKPFDSKEKPFDGGTRSDIIHEMQRGLDFEPEVRFTIAGTKILEITRASTPPAEDTTAETTPAAAEDTAETPLTPAGDTPERFPPPPFKITVRIPVLPAPAPEVPTARVALIPPDPPPSEDAILWSFINLITNRLRFDEFHEFVRPRMVGRNGPEWYGTDAYQRLQRAALDFVGVAADPIRAATEAERRQAAAQAEQIEAASRGISGGGHWNGRHNGRYGSTVQHELTKATAQAGVQRSYVSDERADLAEPFLRYAPRGLGPRPAREVAEEVAKEVAKEVAREVAREVTDQPDGPAAGLQADGRPAVRFPLPNVPFVELIWNYWQEEGMLVQTLNHILARFQNRRTGPGLDVLARFDLNPLLPLRNLLWGFAEDERRRLTVRRRAAEYEYQYGLRLQGRAIPPASTVVERRALFLEAFHGLLHACHGYFKERDDKTVDADAFPLLSSLREVHLVLARGAHNQFADLPLTARSEMLTMQWILAQPEMREFLGGPTMVPYEEPWMDRVDTMKSLQSWSEASVTHFFELATHGEQIVLSVRHGRWNESSKTREDASNWALTWRNEIQRYIHAYRTVTGVDLATGIDATMPSTLLARRLVEQQR